MNRILISLFVFIAVVGHTDSFSGEDSVFYVGDKNPDGTMPVLQVYIREEPRIYYFHGKATEYRSDPDFSCIEAGESADFKTQELICDDGSKRIAIHDSDNTIVFDGLRLTFQLSD